MAKTLASAILAAILDVCEIKDQKDGESRQAFLLRCVKEVNDLPDAAWKELPKEATDWFNAAADVAETNKKSGKGDPLPDFPDLPKDEAKAPAGRRRASEEDDGPVKAGRFVTVVTKRGKEVQGKVVEADDKAIVVKDKDGEEHEFDMDRVETVRVHNDGADPEPEGPAGPQPGDQVAFTTKRGKEVTGELVELTADAVVVKYKDGDVDDFPLSRIEGDVKVVGAAEKPAAGRRGAAPAKPAMEADGKAPRTVNKGGVSVGQACKEILADDPDATLEEMKKALTKRGVDFKDVTAEMNYTELTRFIKCLREAKKLK